MANIDVYGIARMLIREHGDQACTEIHNKINQYSQYRDFNAIKRWYEIEDAFNEIRETHVKHELAHVE